MIYDKINKSLDDIHTYNSKGVLSSKVHLLLLEKVTNAIHKELGWVTNYQGSFSTQTMVAGYSDFDLVYCFDGTNVHNAKQLMIEKLLILDGFLLSLCKHDVDGYLDIPAFIIKHLKYSDRIIEINTAVFSFLQLGNEWTSGKDDMLILKGQGNEIVHTNPYLHYKTVDFLDKITNGQYRKLVIFLKLWNYQNNFSISSFTLELLVYYYFRGTKGYLSNQEIFGGEPNLNFLPLHVNEGLFENLLGIFSESINIFIKSSNKSIVQVHNPFVRKKLPLLINLFDSINQQNQAIKNMNESLNLLYSIQENKMRYEDIINDFFKIQ